MQLSEETKSINNKGEINMEKKDCKMNVLSLLLLTVVLIVVPIIVFLIFNQEHLNEFASGDNETYINEDISKIANLYITVISDLMNADVALSHDVQYIAVDIDTFVNLSEEDIINIIEYLQRYNEAVKQTTFEELREQGLVNEELPVSIEGIMVSIADVEFISENEVNITISQWSSGRSAVSIEYVAIYENGEWKLYQTEIIMS